MRMDDTLGASPVRAAIAVTVLGMQLSGSFQVRGVSFRQCDGRMQWENAMRYLIPGVFPHTTPDWSHLHCSLTLR